MSRIEIFETRYTDNLNLRAEPGILYFNKQQSKILMRCPGNNCQGGVLIDGPHDNWEIKDTAGKITIEPSMRHDPCGHHYNIKDNKVIWHLDSPP